jgi:protein PhnA
MKLLIQSITIKEGCLMVCNRCLSQMEKKEELDGKHWSCLTTSMCERSAFNTSGFMENAEWFREESWATENLDMMY